MKGPSPAFQFYPKDWLSDAQVRAMTFEEKGVYMDLLAVYWLEDGLPAALSRLARLLGIPQRRLARLWPAIGVCFTVEGERLIQKRAEEEKSKQVAYRRSQAEKGSKGGKSRHINKDRKLRLSSGLLRLKPKSSLSVSVPVSVSVPIPESLPTTATATTSAPKGAGPAGAEMGKLGSDEPPPTAATPGEARDLALAVLGPPAGAWSREACDDWVDRFGGTAPGGRIGAALKPLVKRIGWDEVRPAWRRYLAEKEADFATAQDFAAKFGEWVIAPATGTGQAILAARANTMGQPSKADRLDAKVTKLIGGPA